MADNYNQKPDKVKWAIWLLWVSLVLGTLSSIPWTLEPLPPELPKWFPWSVIIFGNGLFALLIYFTSKRYNWARIGNLILFLVGLLLSVWDIASLFTGPVFAWSVSLLSSFMEIIALYWLFTGEGSVWFKRAHIK